MRYGFLIGLLLVALCPLTAFGEPWAEKLLAGQNQNLIPGPSATLAGNS